MKSFIFALVALFTVSFAHAQGTTPAKTAPTTVSGPVMTFETTTVDYGKVAKGSDRVRKFKFTNTGNEPLVIKDAKGSCGCTVPSWPKEPIMPGQSNYIEVNYDTNREGMFTKSVTLTTNEGNPTHSLTIKGEVLKPDTEKSVPENKNPFTPN